MKSIKKYTILENKMIAKQVYRLVLSGEIDFVSQPGQFVNFTIEGFYLKRPISICDVSETTFTCIYKVLGEGTKQMSTWNVGKEVEVLVGLGNGFDCTKVAQQVVLLGGGVGVPPMYSVAKKCLELNKQVSVCLGFASRDDAFYIDEFKALGVDVYVSSNDGTIGEKGFVSDLMIKHNLLNHDYLACGPHMMLRSIAKTSHVQGLLSFEERMGCGFGACMGCSCKTLTGYKRICVEGPVMESGEIIWKD